MTMLVIFYLSNLKRSGPLCPRWRSPGRV